MLSLDKVQFNREISVAVATVNSLHVNLSQVLPLLKKYLLKIENFKPVQTTTGMGESVAIYLHPDKVRTWSDLAEPDRERLEALSVTKQSLETVRKVVGYDNFSADEIFKAVLPADKEGMASFTKVGHIVHLNLRDHLLPYKGLIGQVLREKVPNCRTVVNKTSNIDSTYRNFKMEILSGEDDMLVKLKESGCAFEMDFSTVYWNSRLSTEHERIVKKLHPGDVLFDVFAGVGPFSIPAAKKQCHVYANDLNPESFKWLNHNAKLNKIHPKLISTYNKDAKDFICTDLKANLLKHINASNVYVTMNLPALAYDFLSSFFQLYNRSELTEIKNCPTLFLYCFAKGEDPLQITRDLIRNSVGQDISRNIVDIFKVRTVSSLKEMMRVTIKLDEDILLGKQAVKRKSAEDANSKVLKKS